MLSVSLYEYAVIVVSVDYGTIITEPYLSM